MRNVLIIGAGAAGMAAALFAARGGAAVTGRFCVIGSQIREQALKELFKIG